MAVDKFAPYKVEHSKFKVRPGPAVQSKKLVTTETFRIRQVHDDGETPFARKSPISKTSGTAAEVLFREYEIYQKCSRYHHIPQDVKFEVTPQEGPCLILPWLQPLHLSGIRDLLSTVKCLATTYAHLHAAGVTHCDIKPGNIMMDMDHATPMIIDFGFAALAPPVADGASHSFLPIGATEFYAAPEVKSRRRSDVFSLGIAFLGWVCSTLDKHPPRYLYKLRKLHAKIRDRGAWTREALAQVLDAIENSTSLQKIVQFQPMMKLARDMLAWDILDRPTMAQVVNRLLEFKINWKCDCHNTIDLTPEASKKEKDDDQNEVIQDALEALVSQAKILSQFTNLSTADLLCLDNAVNSIRHLLPSSSPTSGQYPHPTSVQ